MQIQFFGAAREVTGSKHLLTTDSGTRVLLDCGLFQEAAKGEEPNRHFGFDPKSINHLILSHAHIDHSGLVPRLYREGFRGKIYCTTGTYEMCRIMLADSAHIQESDLSYVNKRRKKRGEPLLEPLYDITDVTECLKLFTPQPYNTITKVADDITLLFTDAGHIIGSAVINLQVQKQGGDWMPITFTGDIGRIEDKILRSPQPFPQCEVLICESTYGDRLHEKENNADERLLKIVEQTCVNKKGKLIIPAFSVDRTQELIYQLEKLENAGLLPAIKVYVDSPLSTNTTNIMRNHTDEYNEDFKAYMKHDPVPFSFKNLVFVANAEESKQLNSIADPCIIISASGMAEAGRIKHHIKNHIGDADCTILIVGYCTPQSLGGRLRNGNKKVRIFGEELNVVASVEVMDSYSGHADYEEIFQFLSHQNKSLIGKIILIHGEEKTQLVFREKFLALGYHNILIPSKEEIIEL